MRFFGRSVGLVAALALMMTGCGSDKSSTSSATTTTAATAKLDQFLIRADEAPGLSPSGEPTRLGSLNVFAAEFNSPAAEEQRLREHGFTAHVEQMLVGTPDAAGISAVDLFASEDGASQEFAYLVANKEKDAPAGVVNFVRFDVPGVPGAAGWTFDKPGGGKAADVNWSQGRCVLSLGSEPPMLDQLRAGAKALYDRTGGHCS